MTNGTSNSDDGAFSLADWIVADVTAFVNPLLAAGLSPDAAVSLLENVGWQLDAVPGLPAVVSQVCGDVDTALTTLAAVAGGPAASGAPVSALTLVQNLISAIQGISTAIAGLSQAQAHAQLPGLGQLAQDLLAWLTDNYLLSSHPLARGILVLGQLLTPQETAPVQPAVLDSSGQVVRAAYQLPALHLDRLGALLRDPASFLRAAYMSAGSLVTPADVQALADALFPVVADVLNSFGLGASYGLDPYFDEVQLDPASAALMQHALSLWLLDSADAGAAQIGATFALVGPDDTTGGRVGAVVAPTFPTSIGGYVGGWSFTASLTAGGAPLSVVSWVPSPADPSGWPGLGLTLTLAVGGAATTPADPTAPAPPGAQIVVQLSVGETFEASLSLSAQASLSLDPGDFADGFLQAILPSGGIVLPLGLTITGSQGGWALAGSIPKGQAIVLAQFPPMTAGPLTIGGLRFQVTAADTSFVAGAYFTASLAIGPVTAAVSDLGLGMAVQWPPGGGNAGLLDLAPQVLWPTGIGLAVDAGPVSGGGFLSRDPASGRYAGALELRMESLALKAIGLLDTRLPDGSEGYSLIVIITAEFEAIQLGFGFTLTGVGGLAGINRTVVIDALRAGVVAHRLNNILFPADPIRNAGQILSDLATIFPPDAGNYIFGPMVQLGWGTPQILTLELGLLLELPPPLRLIVLGRIALNLPDPDAPLVQIQMDSLGVVDFGTGQIAVDALLFGSNIAGFALTGSMALRACWLGQPSFALAIGGFNPGFTPPAQFPALNRITIALAAGNNPRLRLAAYLAVTSNTAQVGARLDLFVQGPLGITVQGALSFDALFQFNPFQFVVAIGGSVTIMSNGQPVLSASVSVTLTGPNGWHVQGSASFELFGFSVSVSFDTTIGTAQPLPAPTPVQLAPILETALTTPANWNAALPADASTLLTFSAAHAATPASGAAPAPAHPLAALAVHQQVLPLGIAIARYGSATPADPGTFTITTVTIGGTAAPALTPLNDWFAPGQFLQLSGSDSLQRPSYEQLQAGVAVTTPPFLCDPAPPPAIPAGYVTLVYDTLGGTPREVVLPGPTSMTAAAMVHAPAASTSAPGTSPDMTTAPPLAMLAVAPAASRGRGRFQAPGLQLLLTRTQYALASSTTLAGPTPPPPEPASYAATAQNLVSYLAANPSQAGQVQIVAGYEVQR